MSEPDRDLSGRTGGEPIVPPRPVDLARWLWIIAAVISFVRSLFQLSDRAHLISELRRVSPQMTQEQLDSAANSGIAFTIVVSLAVVALYVTFANRAVRGRNWARIVIAALAGLSALGTVIMLGVVLVRGADQAARITGIEIPVTPWEMLLNLVVVVLNIATVVLLFRPESNRFFRDMARSRVVSR